MGYEPIEPQSDEDFSKIKEYKLLDTVNETIKSLIVDIRYFCDKECQEKNLCKGCKLYYELEDLGKFEKRFLL